MFEWFYLWALELGLSNSVLLPLSLVLGLLLWGCFEMTCHSLVPIPLGFLGVHLAIHLVDSGKNCLVLLLTLFHLISPNGIVLTVPLLLKLGHFPLQPLQLHRVELALALPVANVLNSTLQPF